MKRSARESIIAMLISYGLVLILLSLAIGGFVLPTLAWDTSVRSKAELYIIAGSWLGLLLFSSVVCDRIAGYFCMPKEERGDFWFIKEILRLKTIDLSEIEREARQEREAETFKDSKT